MTPRLIVKQKITAFVNKYSIFAANPDGTAGDAVALAQQKRIALKEKIMVYADQKRDKLAFTLRAEKVLDVHGRYFVEDTAGNIIGMFKKEFMSSLAVSTWKILDKNGQEMLLVRENNLTLALLRRFIVMIPFVGEFGEVIISFFRYHFEFIDITNSEVVGMYEKTTLFRDHYRLSMTDAAWEQTDWRVFAAMGVALDALQSR